MHFGRRVAITLTHAVFNVGGCWKKSWHSQNISTGRFYFISVQSGRSSAVQPQTNEANDWFFFPPSTNINLRIYYYYLQWVVARNTLLALSVQHSPMSPHLLISAVVNASREHRVLFRGVSQTQQGYVACDAGKLSIFPHRRTHNTNKWPMLIKIRKPGSSASTPVSSGCAIPPFYRSTELQKHTQLRL